MGNSERIARQHYLQVISDHYERAACETQQIPQQSPSVTGERTMPMPTIGKAKTPEKQGEGSFRRGFLPLSEWRIGDSNP
jgi:hypothetical protein